MRVTFADRPCLDVAREAANLAQRGWPAPPELARANCLLNPLGESPGRAWVLMLREDVVALDRAALHDLVFDDQIGGRVAVRNLVFVAARRLTQSRDEDTAAAYLVEAADARWRCHNPFFSIACNKQYNVRAPGWGGSSSTDPNRYYADSLNSGALWSWSGLVGDLWGLLTTQLGAAPTLPIAPDGTPEDWRFVGVSAWRALCEVLERIGCAVRWDPMAATSPYTIVQIGATDATFDAAEALAVRRGRKIHDEDWIEGTRGRAPRGCRVFFHRVNTTYGTEETTNRTTSQWSTTPAYSVDVDGSDNTGAETGAYHPLWDDLPALYTDAGAVSNAAALATRAAERTADFFRTLRSTGGGRVARTYSGIHPLVPGGPCKGVAWRQRGDSGLVTEIVRHPWRMLRASDASAGGPGWEELEDSTRLQPPDLRPTVPNYPHLLQTLQVLQENALLAGGLPLFDCFVLRWVDAPGNRFVQRERVWAVDLGFATYAYPGDLRLGRLIGYASGRPLYAFRIATPTTSARSGTTLDPYGGSFVVWDAAPPNFPAATEILIPKPGFYSVLVQVDFNLPSPLAATAKLEAELSFNGVSIAPTDYLYRSTGFHPTASGPLPSTGLGVNTYSLQVCGLRYCAAGQRLAVRLRSNSFFGFTAGLTYWRLFPDSGI